MVLCRSSKTASTSDLYVFGSNYFGQLGVGQYVDGDHDKPLYRSVVPIRLELPERIRLMHTKFFASVSIALFIPMK